MLNQGFKKAQEQIEPITFTEDTHSNLASGNNTYWSLTHHLCPSAFLAESVPAVPHCTKAAQLGFGWC